jgi:quercetin dioxygenase-like cupin family protein
MIYSVEKWREVYAPNPAMLRFILVSEGYKVYQWCDRPGSVYGRHMHGEDQSHWVISGTLELTIENVGTFILEAGDRDLMPAGTFHSARVIGDEPVVYLIGERRDHE